MAVLTRTEVATATNPPSRKAAAAAAELHRRLRGRSDAPDDALATYGPRELSLAADFGAIEALLVTAAAADAAMTAVQAETTVRKGGKVYVFADASAEEHAQLSLLGGAAALLRFPIDWSPPADGGPVGTPDAPTRGLCSPALGPPRSAADVAAALLASRLDDGPAAAALPEVVADEFEALAEIFPPGLAEAPTEFCPLGEGNPECLIALRTATAHLRVMLRVTLPPEYPDRPATVAVVDAARLDAATLSGVLEVCNARLAVEAQTGEPALFTLISNVHEHLAAVNADTVCAVAA